MQNTELRMEISPYAQYQDFLRKGQLAYQFDVAAGRAVFYPRVVSPYGGKMEWRVSEGLGTVHAASWISPREGGAYSVVLVDMDEGFRLMSNVIGSEAQSVSIGDRVRVRIHQDEDGQLIPLFERVRAGELP